MDQQEKITLKAACVQASATLVAALVVQMRNLETNPRPDTGMCVRFARDLFGKLTGEPWDEEPAAPPPRPR